MQAELTLLVKQAELLDDLEALDDIESELELDDWDLDIYFD